MQPPLGPGPGRSSSCAPVWSPRAAALLRVTMRGRARTAGMCTVSSSGTNVRNCKYAQEKPAAAVGTFKLSKMPTQTLT